MVTSVLSWVWIGSGVLLIISVLLHSPKGDGMGGLAASGGSMFTSARSAEATLNRISWTLLAIFLALAVVLSAGWLGCDFYAHATHATATHAPSQPAAGPRIEPGRLLQWRRQR